MASDPEIEHVVSLVVSMVEPVQALFAPAIAEKVFRNTFPFIQQDDTRAMVAISNT